jgi:hypothetical protein
MTQPLDSSRDLRIGAPTAIPPDQPLWRGTDATAQPGVRLSDPQAANTPPPSPPPVATPTSLSSSPAAIPTAPAVVLTGGNQIEALDQALRQLRTGRQVTWVRLETLESGGWRFQCMIADSTNPEREFRHDGTGATEVEAVHKVLDQIALERH